MNRKNFHSINTQIVFDSRLQIRNINARYPGSFHDSLIWKSSLVYSFMRDIYNATDQIGEDFKYFLIGDTGFPLEPWLLKSYDLPCVSYAQVLFNKLHMQMRSLIERGIGVWKARFRCLLGDERKLRYDHLSSGYVIYTCAVLHNFLIRNGYPIENNEPIFDESIDNFDDYDFNELELLGLGQQKRDAMSQYFADNN